MSERRGPWNSLSQIVGRIEDLESAVAALLELDWQNSVLDRFDPTAALPVGPSTGDRYISTATANGWTDTYLYEWSGSAWTEYIPSEGWAAWVEDENKVYVFNGASWVAIGSATDHNILANLQGGTAGEYYHLTQAIHDALYSGSPIIGMGAVAGTNIEVDYGNHVVTVDLDGEAGLVATKDGAVELYYAGTKVVETTVSGLDNPMNDISRSGKTGWDRSDWDTVSFSFSYPTFTLTDSGGSHEFWVEGVKYSKTGDQTCTITDTEGQWFFYYNNSGVLECSQTPWEIEDEDICLVANGYWDAVNNEMILLGMELHTYHMPAATHYHMHEVIGCLYEEGFAITDNADGTIDISAGELHDEDIQIKVTDDSGSGFWDQTLTPAELPIYYRDGASGLWRRTYNSTATYFVYQDGGDNPYWNNPAGPWTQAVSDNNQYSAVWIVATNNIDEPVIVIVGQGAPSNLLNTAIANNDINNLDLSLLPAQEFKILYRVMIQNAGSPYTVSTITDFRTAQSVGGTSAVVNSHGALNGLQDDDHPQYALLAGRDAQQLILDPALGTDLTATGTILKDATVDANATGIGAALYLAADFHYDEADASAAATMRCTAMALEAGTGSKDVLLEGFIRNDAWDWSAGDIYVSLTTGGLTQTAPSASGEQVQVVGWAYSADIMYFKPSSTVLEIA